MLSRSDQALIVACCLTVHYPITRHLQAPRLNEKGLTQQLALPIFFRRFAFGDMLPLTMEEDRVVNLDSTLSKVFDQSWVKVSNFLA